MTETDAEFVEALVEIAVCDWDQAQFDRFFALARRGAAVQWRPISEMSGKGRFIVFGGRWVGEIAAPYERTNAGALVDENLFIQDTDYYSAEINDPTHFIPLTALGEPNE